MERSLLEPPRDDKTSIRLRKSNSLPPWQLSARHLILEARHLILEAQFFESLSLGLIIAAATRFVV